MSNKRGLRGLLFGILASVPIAGLAVATPTGTVTPGQNASSTQEAPTHPQNTQNIEETTSSAILGDSVSVETPIGGAGVGVEVPADQPQAGDEVTVPVVPPTGVIVTADSTTVMSSPSPSGDINTMPPAVGDQQPAIPGQPDTPTSIPPPGGNAPIAPAPNPDVAIRTTHSGGGGGHGGGHHSGGGGHHGGYHGGGHHGDGHHGNWNHGGWDHNSYYYGGGVYVGPYGYGGYYPGYYYYNQPYNSYYPYYDGGYVYVD